MCLRSSMQLRICVGGFSHPVVAARAATANNVRGTACDLRMRLVFRPIFANAPDKTQPGPIGCLYWRLAERYNATSYRRCPIVLEGSAFCRLRMYRGRYLHDHNRRHRTDRILWTRESVLRFQQSSVSCPALRPD